MFTQIFTIVGLFIKSIGDFKSGATKYLLYSGLIALAILSIIFYFTWNFSGKAGLWLASLIPWTWAHESAVFTFIVGISILFLFWILMKYIMLMLLAPILSVVSEKAELQLTGMLGGAGFSFANATARSVRINLRNMTKEIVMTVFLLIAALIPGINIFAVGVLFVVQAYFAGFGIMDFYLERHFTFRETIAEVYKHKFAAITLGGIFTLLLLIPVLGVIVAPYFTTVTATRYFANLKAASA